MSILENISKNGLDRREFVRNSTIALALLGLTGSLAGCDTSVKETGGPSGGSAPEPLSGGEWIPVGCNYDCGGRCLNVAYVVDGVVVRQKTDDTHKDDPLFLQQRACPRGRSHRNMIYSADRIRYPMKRKNWKPLTGGKKELRGKDEWVRISWDEAIDIIVTEMEHAKKNYGNESIYLQAVNGLSAANAIETAMQRFGGYLSGWCPASFGAWFESTSVGLNPMNNNVNDRYDLQNCDTILLWSNNPAWGAACQMFYYYLQIRKAGCKFYTIDPYFTESAGALNATWMPVRPGTDTALCLAMMYIMITEDDDKNLIDWDFLRAYTVGFDETMMPKDAPDKNYHLKNYVLGKLDGVPKTPEWASELCGLEPEKIRELAYALDKNKKVAIISGCASGRQTNVSSINQSILALGCMTGHIGKSGHSTGTAFHRMGINTGPWPYRVADIGMPAYSGGGVFSSPGADPNTRPSTVKSWMHLSESWDAILKGEAYITHAPAIMSPPRGQEKRKVDIHVLANYLANTLGAAEGGEKAIEAFRKVDFVWSLGIYPSDQVKYSDVILPKTTFWEGEGFITAIGTRDAVICTSKAIEPLYEAKTYDQIGRLLFARMFPEEKLEEFYPKTEKEQFFHQLRTTSASRPDGTSVPLCSVTRKDMDDWGVTGEPQEGLIPVSELVKKGVYKFDIKPGDEWSFIAFKDFINDPKGAPLRTRTGKFELYSQAHADMVNNLGWSKITPLGEYVTGPERYEKTFKDWKKKVKGEYPFQVISVHYLGHAHTNFTNNAWVQEAFTAPILMNASDAAGLDIKEGDPVLLTSKYGKIVRPAAVSERVIPGVMVSQHGGWRDIDEESGIDFGGCDNHLGAAPLTGGGVCPFNSILAKAEKYRGKFTPDHLKPRNELIKE